MRKYIQIQAKYRSWVILSITGFAIAAFIGLVLISFLFNIFIIPTKGMTPTIEAGDVILGFRFSYWFSSPHRGDVIIFWADWPSGANTYVKRLVALPGDVIKFSGKSLYVNGTPYRYPGQTIDYRLPNIPGTFLVEEQSYTVPAGKMFVLGDYIPSTLDSRCTGPVPLDNLRDKVYAVIWPINRISWVR